MIEHVITQSDQIKKRSWQTFFSPPLPQGQAVEQLFPRTELLHQHHVVGGYKRSVQLYQVRVMKPFQQLVLTQHQLSLLWLVRRDLGSEHLAGLHVPTKGYYTEATPERGQMTRWGGRDDKTKHFFIESKIKTVKNRSSIMTNAQMFTEKQQPEMLRMFIIRDIIHCFVQNLAKNNFWNQKQKIFLGTFWNIVFF